MKSATTVRRVVLSIIGVFITLAVGAVAVGVQAAQSSPDFAISISPTSQTVQRVATASYTVTVTSLNAFSGSVTLTTSGGPSNTALGASTLNPTAGVPGTTTLTAPTTATTNTGAYTITVSAVSGKLKKSATTGLTVNPITPGIALSLTPASLSVDAGTSGTYTVGLTRLGGFVGAVSLTATGLPVGAIGTFSPASLSGTASSSLLTIAVDGSAKAGSSTITVVGTASATLSTSTQGTLVIAKPQGKPFTITGDVVGLAPGVSQPINLLLANTNKGVISVTNLTVQLTSTNKTTCASTNFLVKQYTGAYPITVPGDGSISLSAWGIIDAQRPAITMLNTALNQDSCKGVSLSLSYSGSAQGN